MKKHISYLMIALGAFSFSACNQEVMMSESYGYLDMHAETDLSADVIVKAPAQDKTYAVDVKNGQGVVHHTDDHRTISTSSPLRLPVGTYEVVAYEGKNLNAAFDNPYYEGKTTVKIQPDITTIAKITCSLANTMFSVEFPTDFSQKFAEYKVTVNNGKDTPLVLCNKPLASNANEGGFDKTAYFAVTGKLNWELYLKNLDGGEYRITKTIDNVAAKQHYHLKFEMDADQPTVGGAFSITVKLNNSMSVQSQDIVLDFDNRKLPTSQSAGDFEITSGVLQSIPVGNKISKVLMISTPAGLKSFRLTHNDAKIKEMGLPESVEAVGAPVETETMLNNVGIHLNQIVGASTIVEGAIGLSVDVTNFLAKLPVGKYQMAMTTIDVKGHTSVFNLIVEIVSDVDAEAIAAKTGWAAFARLEGRYFTSEVPVGLTFQYKEKNTQDWVTVMSTDIKTDPAKLTYSATVKGLKPATTYVFKAISTKDQNTKELEFTTTAAPTIHNLSFDEWSSNDRMPNAASGPQVWDSANSAPKIAGITTTTPVSDAVKGRAARLESTTGMGMFAAGNIFTGRFVGLAGLGAKLDWGTEFNGRPIALKGYYKYNPKTINYAEGIHADKKGQTDQSQILIFLTDWAGKFQINTSSQTFVDLENDPAIIAVGQMNTNTLESQYKEFTIPLVYRNNRTPKYLVIAAAASRYGDYFTGAVGSVLHLDEFELVYDPAKLTDEEFKTVFSKVEAFN